MPQPLAYHLVSSRIVINAKSSPYIDSTYSGPVNETVTYTESRGDTEIIILNPPDIRGKETISHREKDRLTRVVKFADKVDGNLASKEPKIHCKFSQVVGEYSASPEEGRKVRAKITFTSTLENSQEGGVKMTVETAYKNGALVESKIDIYDPARFRNVEAVSIKKPENNVKGREITIHKTKTDGSGNVHLIYADCKATSPTRIFITYADGKEEQVDVAHAAEHTELYKELKQYSDKYGAGDVLKATKQLASVVKKDLPVEKGAVPTV